MCIGNLYITIPNEVPKKPLVEVVQEICVKTEPKPLFCEIPEDLKLRPFSNYGTVQTYTITSSMMSGASGYGTSTTTTTT